MEQPTTHIAQAVERKPAELETYNGSLLAQVLDLPRIVADLKERIEAIRDSADQLHNEVLRLNQEVWSMDGIDKVVHLADVPYYVSTAATFANNLTTCLGVAAEKAGRGGA